MHFTPKRRQQQKAAKSRSAAAAGPQSPVTVDPAAPVPPPRNPARNIQVPLISVPEAPTNPGVTLTRPPPSAFRNFAHNGFGGGKGKERQHEADHASHNGWSQWVVDPLESRRGADIWSQGDRVILVLGEPTVESLAPLLYSSVFIDTLLLVGSIQPLPEIEALTSPSHLMSLGEDRTIYPTVQPFQPAAEVLKGSAHPLHVLLKQASAIADVHRQRNNPDAAPPSRPASWGSRSRRGSGTSVSGSMTPPGTPPQQSLRSRFSTFGRRSTASSPAESPTGSVVDLSRSPAPSQKRTPSIMSAPVPDRPRGLRRIGSLLSLEPPRPCEGAPFDAVINFIPPAAASVDPQRVLQDMLHHTTVVTTAVLPMMMTQSSANSVAASTSLGDLAPLTVLHIVPSDAPLMLAPVLERFLIPLLPQLGQRTRRELFGCITGPQPWLARATDSTGDGLSGAETILFGGLRSPQQDGLRTQALLSSWSQCVTSHGSLVDTVHRGGDSPPTFSRRASSQALSDIRSAHASGHPLSLVSSPPSPTASTKASPPRADKPLPHKRSMPVMAPRAVIQQDSSAPTSPAAADPPSSYVNRTFTSRFDPRMRDGSPAREGMSEPPYPAAFGSHMNATSPKSPSGLRNSHQPSVQTSPPTPELDPSSSSCSSSSVMDPPPDERSVNSGSRRTIPSVPNGKAPAVTKPSKFGSLFRRSRAVKA